VRRLLPYVILALALHAVILSTDFSWLRFASRPTLAAKSLTISLSANRPQKPKTPAAAAHKRIERQLEPILNQRPAEDLDAIRTPARVNQSQNPLPAEPAKPVAQKTRHKRSLKALTYKKQPIKPVEAIQAVPRKAETPVFSPARTEPEEVRRPLPADPAFIKKTHQVPEGVSTRTTAAASPTATRSDEPLSGSILKIARPLYSLNSPPAYPRKARRLGYEGTVILKVLIDEDGRVDDLMLLESSGHTILDRAAVSAVRKWQFVAGTEGGIKKKMWVKIPIRFQLE
jgi:protein TonB